MSDLSNVAAAHAAGSLDPAATRPGFLTVTLRSKLDLYQAWMPFIAGGGLFVPTPRSYSLGDEVFMLLALLDEQTKIPLQGRVVWINPVHTSAGRPQGIGVQLEDSSGAIELRGWVEKVLATVMGSSRATHTL